jgi:hypothetical protein
MLYRYKTLLLNIIIIFVATSTLFAQMERERVQTDETVSDVFWTPTLITQGTTENIASGNLNVTIMHSFGIATQRPLQTFFGIDNVQNVRLGLDYGISDRWSIGIGRSSLTNIYDLRSKVALLRQKGSGSVPINLSIKGDIGLITQENRQPLKDDLNTFVSLIASRKFNDTFSLQVSPMYGYFSNVSYIDGNEVFGVGIGTEVHLSRRFALTAEYYPVLGDRPSGTQNTFSMGLNIETGGHVFQLFFTSTEWHLEQFVMADNSNQFWAGDFRFGFNVNRIFGL